ncbi:hypothetical protein [Psychrobacter sp. JB385]|uniref:hypothetical protein n=1 Tax=Psychrobacter sp. JB385 TaxID=1434841 RepID=UPI00097E9918|nr:hypothetical protein [Psychrobacter sp. JB385]SJN20269.1 hypothetical protein CZ794_02670 [Psychrobacter sp. JB385]
MKNKYEKMTTPLLHPRKEEYLCAEYYDLYWGLACAEFKFTQGTDTYFFYSLSISVEHILLFLLYLDLPNPCPTVKRFEQFYTNFDEAFDDWYEIENKPLFVENLKQVTVENYINLRRQRTEFNDRDIQIFEIMDLAKSLVWLVEDSTDNSLLLRYD